MPSYGVSLLSGRLDSTTITDLAKDQIDHLTALTFHYGQSHSKEIEYSAAVARSLGVPQVLATSKSGTLLLVANTAARLQN